MKRFNQAILAFVFALGIVAAFAAPALADAATPIVVTMGDSYASGEGIEPFYDQDDPYKFWNQDWVGHRSMKSYSGQLVIGGYQLNSLKATPAWGVTSLGYNSYMFSDDEYTNDGTWFFVAASASSIDNVYGGTDGDSMLYRGVSHPGNELTGSVSYSAYWAPQISVFDYINAKYGENSTDYVILNVSGVDFGLVQSMVVAAFTNSRTSLSALNLTINGFKSGWNITNRDHYIDMVNAIIEAAGPQVKIIAVGYPLLFDGAGEDSNISSTEMTMLDNYMTWIDAQLKGCADEINASGFDNFYYVSTLDLFKGHGMNSADSYLVPIIFEAQDEDIDHSLIMQYVSPYTLHPNEKGATVIAAEVQKLIDKIEAAENPHTPGWAYENGSYYYYNADGTMLRNGWASYQGEYYYFGADGKLVKNGWGTYEGVYYYLGSDGRVVKNGWGTYEGDYYFLDGNGRVVTNAWRQYKGSYYYFGDDGKLVVNDWVKYAGKYYYIGANGTPLVNTSITIGGITYYFGKDGACTGYRAA